MSEHQNVNTVNCMTGAALSGDADELAKVFTPDVKVHLRGALPGAGDYEGPEGFLQVVGGIIERTMGEVKLDQQFCIGDGNWAAEWEHCVLGIDGKEYETMNSFVYRFESGRIAEMWFINTELPTSALAAVTQ